jgi:outer membrane lipoprotein SlyB
VSFLRLVTFAAWVGCLTGAAGPTAAQPAESSRIRQNTVPVVEGFGLERVAELAPGVSLNFSVYGSPHSAVTLAIEGGRRLVDLPETEPGIYEGSYIIDAADRIRPDSRVVASLQRDGQVARSTLDEPLLLARGTLPWTAVEPRPGLPTTVPAPPPTAVPAPTNVPAPRDAGARAAPLLAATPAPWPQQVPHVAPLRETCADCAVVESIRTVEAPPRPGVIGAVSGAIAGAIVGNELAEAHRRHMMRVLGAIGGLFLGREIEIRSARPPSYEAVLRLPDGSALIRRYEQPPSFHPGDTISLSSGVVRRAVRSAIS